MDNQPVQNPIPEPALTPTLAPISKPRFPVMYLVLSVFILLFLASTAFLYYQNMQLKNMLANYQAPAASPTPTADPTANWKIYTSSCGFLMKYPEGWKAQKYFIVDKNTSCSFLTSPDYEQGLDSRTGFWIEVTRLAKGTINVGAKVNTVDDYIKSIEDSYMKSSIEPLPPLIKVTKTYSTFQGIQFDLSEFESVTTFVFSHENYLWMVKWPTATQYSGSSRADLDQILSTFKFTQ